MSVSIVSARLPTGDTPVCSVTLEPYVLIKRGETTVTADDIPEEGSSEPGLQLRSRWYRSSIPRGGAVCSVHPEKEATVQCAVCLRSKVAVHLSYHCTAECFKRSWAQHLEYHRQAHANGEGCTGVGRTAAHQAVKGAGGFGTQGGQFSWMAIAGGIYLLAAVSTQPHGSPPAPRPAQQPSLPGNCLW